MNRRGFFAAFVGGSASAAAPKAEKKRAGLQVESYASWMCGRCGRALVFEGDAWHTRVMRCKTPSCPEYNYPYRAPRFTAEPAREPKPVAVYELSPEPHLRSVAAPPELADFDTYENFVRACARREVERARGLLP
jgi:hypothetical protein